MSKASIITPISLALYLAVAAGSPCGASDHNSIPPTELTHRRQYTVAEIAAMYARPKNVVQLLQNLEIAMDRDLLLQHSFDDDDNLKRFFNGSAVKREPILNQLDGSRSGLEDVSVIVDDRLFPAMRVHMRQGELLQRAYDAAVGGANAEHVPEHRRRFGFIELKVAEVPGFTVRIVHEVFGPHAEATLDSGIAPHGVVYIPAKKGSVVYRYAHDLVNEFPPIDKKMAVFNIKLTKSQPMGDSRSWKEDRAIHDEDEVADLRIESWER